MKSPHTRRPKPRLSLWLFQRDITLREGAAALDISYEWMRRICLPFDDARWAKPDPALQRRIESWTAGEIVPGDFEPPAGAERAA